MFKKLTVPNIIPNDLQQKINILIKTKYSIKPNLLISLFYLLRDIIYAFLVVFMTILLEPYINTYILFSLYSIIMGTVCTGLWVIGHECGHGAFGRNKMENDVIGYIIHSSLLVPYFSWQYSHNKHHKYTNHLILSRCTK